MTARPHRTCLLLVLLLGVGLRFTGLTRGSSDSAAPADTARHGASAFHQFHPDERRVLLAALKPVDPLDPAFTVYGLLPVYALRLALHVTMPAGELRPAALNRPDTARRVVATARALAALFSCIALAVTAHLAWRHAGPLPACLAALFVAVAPGVVQQAHFYIVDGPFSLLSLVTVVLALRATESADRAWYAVAGVAIGATAATKLTGLLLGPLLVILHLRSRMPDDGTPWLRRAARPLRSGDLWLAAALAAATLAILEPYLVAEPGLILRNETIEDFAQAAQIARGEILRPWTLADVHTTPYLHHLSHLFPLAVGWPLTLVFIAGALHALWRRSAVDVACLAWIGLYFGLVGGLHAKHVRYLIPLVPLLSLLAADLLSRFCLHRRLSSVWGAAGLLGTAAVILHATLYGLAFAGIYTGEDSRVSAARWIRDELPAGSSIAVETGGFSMAALVSPRHHPLIRLHESRLFGARGYLTCLAAQDLLRRQLGGADYIALIDANRYLQFTAAPDLLPVASGFYTRLLDGEMGFDPIARFTNSPELLGLDFATEHPETSFIGYDHPTVHILRRRADMGALWDSWRSQLQNHPRCPDRSLASAVSLVKSGNLEKAVRRVEAIARQWPESRMASFLEAYIHMERHETELEGQALSRYAQGYGDRSHVAHMIPWASAMSLIGLDLHGLVTSAMSYGHRRTDARHGRSLAALAAEVGEALDACGHEEQARAVYQLAAEVSP